MKLECSHYDTCLSDYFSGHHLPWVCIPVFNGMSFAAVRSALHSELNAGAIGGGSELTRDDSGEPGDAWFKAAHAAINRDVKPAKRGARNAFPDLEKQSDDDCSDSVMAFFVFAPVESA